MRKASLACPRLAQKRDGLLIALLGFLHRDAEAVKLAPAIALADAEIEPAIRQQVQRRGLLGEKRRIVPRQYQHRGAEPQGRGLGGEIGQETECRRDLAEPGEMVLDQENAVKPERFGLADVIDVLGVVVAVADLTADFGTCATEQSEPHRLSFRIRCRLARDCVSPRELAMVPERVLPAREASGGFALKAAVAISSCCPPWPRSPPRRPSSLRYRGN